MNPGTVRRLIFFCREYRSRYRTALGPCSRQSVPRGTDVLVVEDRAEVRDLVVDALQDTATKFWKLPREAKPWTWPRSILARSICC